MLPSGVPLKLRARWSRLLAPFCVGATFLALTAAACSVPEFDFEGGVVVETGGDGNVVVIVPHCTNGRIDADSGESDFDCGRGCSGCGAGKHCGDVADCEEGLLCHEGSCLEAGCMNDAQDGAETDVDCGGGDCNRCVEGQRCGDSIDCESGVCAATECQPAACDDRVKNGKETGLDCGGGCVPCLENEPCLAPSDCASDECNDGICGSECADGFANCDKQNDNACEINTRTNLENCGFCGNVCELPHASAECSAGECQIKADGCEAGYADCNGKPEDGCEIDLKTNKLNCGTCDKVCPDLNGTPSCEAGLCQIACNEGFEDCDKTRDNGCEVNLQTSSKNCNECGKACDAAAGYSPYCKEGACGQTLCPAGKGDCNGDPVDNCETNVTNDVENCGGCGITCQAVNATVACVNSKCVITGCAEGFGDCANGYADGCEANLNTSTAHCGACKQPCTILNGTPKCDQGSCEVSSCSGTFRNCDGDPKSGCETNIATADKSCGGCGAMGKDCTTLYANASSGCSGGACTSPVCLAGFGNCVGGIDDGCETNTTNTPGHCGGCGQACSTSASAHVSTNACVNSQCDPKCAGTYLTCDNNKFNGCEADKDSDESNCGACGTVCSNGASVHTSSNDCSGSTCHPVCSGTYGDCDTSRTNGCEVDMAVSAAHCGGCGMACDTSAAAHVTTNACSGSDCQPKCNGLYDDCDGNSHNGCETPTSGDLDNCGACDVVCGKQNASATACSTGKCTPTCNADWGACTTPEKGCVTPLKTTQNCTKCGEACVSPNVFCGSTGCVDHRDIVAMMSNRKGQVAGWNGSTNVPAEISLQHTLTGTKGVDNRMVLVAVGATDNFTNPTPTAVVTYAGVTMHLAKGQLDTGLHNYTGIYYLLDSELPEGKGATWTALSVFGGNYTWGHAGMEVLELKNTMQVAPIATAGAAADNCGGTVSRSATIAFNQAGSLIYGALAARGATASWLSGGVNGDSYLDTDRRLYFGMAGQQGSPDRMAMVTALQRDQDTGRQLTWSVSDCFYSTIAVVAVKRLNWN
jgi:hypothetical protein